MREEELCALNPKPPPPPTKATRTPPSLLSVRKGVQTASPAAESHPHAPPSLLSVRKEELCVNA